MPSRVHLDKPSWMCKWNWIFSWLTNCLILTSWNWDKSRQERIYLWQLPITLPGPNDHAMNVWNSQELCEDCCLLVWCSRSPAIKASNSIKSQAKMESEKSSKTKPHLSPSWTDDIPLFHDSCDSCDVTCITTSMKMQLPWTSAKAPRTWNMSGVRLKIVSYFWPIFIYFHMFTIFYNVTFTSHIIRKESYATCFWSRSKTQFSNYLPF